MDASTITTATFTVSGVSGNVAYSGTTATFTPLTNLASSTTYTATITTGAKDLVGNSMVSNYIWSFTTGISTGPTLTVTKSGTGSGTVTSSPAGINCGADCTEVYNSGTSVTLTATPAIGSVFAGWSGTCTGTGNCAVTMDAAKSVTVTFNLQGITAGILDPTFGTGGIATTNISGVDIANAIAIQADGKIVIAGYSLDLISSLLDFAVARYNPDGTLDLTFGTGGIVTTNISGSDIAFAIAIQADGKIVVAGTSSCLGTGLCDFALARYNTDGTLDQSFGTGGIVTNDITRTGNTDIVFAVAIQADGKIVAAGEFFSNFGVEFALARYLP